MFRKIIHFVAIAFNIIAMLAVLIFLMPRANSLDEVLAIVFAVALPLISVLALFSLPDLETRKLRRQVEKARLEAELRELKK